MKTKLKAIFSLSLASLFLSLPIMPAQACGPDYPSAVIVNWTHPDLPLKLYAQGNLGVVQPSWARSYMCVAYRYLTGVPLNETEQSSIIRLWHQRLGQVDMFSEGCYSDPLDKYLKVRAKVLGLPDKTYYEVYSPASSYSTDQKIVGSAYDTARVTLEDRVKKYGAKSTQVKEWLNGQDHVFGIGYVKEKSIPDAPGASFDPLMKADRQYQIAAANFYLKNYGEAAKLFEEISKDKNSPWASLAPYLVARAKVNAACDGDQTFSFDDARASIKALLDKETNKDKRLDYQDLLGRLEAVGAPEAMLDRMVPIISKEHSESFGHDVGDVTVLLDRFYFLQEPGDEKKDSSSGSSYDFSKHDMLEWIDTFQRPYDYFYYDSVEAKQKKQEKYVTTAKKSLEKWRKTNAPHWFVAAVSSNSLSNPENKDLFDAALKLDATSPAYLTANFYAIHALIDQKKTEEARKRIQSILAMKNLPPSSQNLFKSQKLAVATTASEYLQAACFNFPTESLNSLFLPTKWVQIEKQPVFNVASYGWDRGIAGDLNRNLPISKFVAMSQDKNLPNDFRKKLTACAWVKGHALKKPEVSSTISNDFSSFYPNLASQIKACDSASDANTRQFLLARLMTKAFGATPYLECGVPRMGSNMLEFNWYHQNYWLPLPVKSQKNSNGEERDWEWDSVVAPGNLNIDSMMKSYYKPGISRLLTAQEKATASKELETLITNHPSRLLGEAVLHYAQANPKDPNAPEALHLIVKLPKWSGSSPVGTEYSKKAYLMLHSNFKGNKWTKKATCFY